SGSDAGSWPLADALARDGATVHRAFDAAHIAGADVVLRSSAYGLENVEVKAATDAGVLVWKRADAWRELSRGERVVAIAGTHGKTTTTALTWTALRAGGVDASLICGAPLRDLGTNAYAGRDRTLVIEADEYDRTFPGAHNALDAAAAVVAAVACGVALDRAADAFHGFNGTARRLEPLGTAGGVTVIDDYAHHPAELRASMLAVRPRVAAGGRLVV